MRVEIGDNGLRSKYYYTAYDIPDAPTLLDAAYAAIRLHYSFLTDDNHTWEARDSGPTKPENQKLAEFTRSSRYTISIKHPEGYVDPPEVPGWARGFKHWFTVAYREPVS